MEVINMCQIMETYKNIPNAYASLAVYSVQLLLTSCSLFEVFFEAEGSKFGLSGVSFKLNDTEVFASYSEFSRTPCSIDSCQNTYTYRVAGSCYFFFLCGLLVLVMACMFDSLGFILFKKSTTSALHLLNPFLGILGALVYYFTLFWVNSEFPFQKGTYLDFTKILLSLIGLTYYFAECDSLGFEKQSQVELKGNSSNQSLLKSQEALNEQLKKEVKKQKDHIRHQEKLYKDKLTDIKSKHKALKKKLPDLEAIINKKKALIKTLNETEHQKNKQIAELQQQNKNLSRKLEDASQELTNYNSTLNQLSNLKKQNKNLISKLTATETSLKNLTRPKQDKATETDLLTASTQPKQDKATETTEEENISELLLELEDLRHFKYKYFKKLQSKESEVIALTNRINYVKDSKNKEISALHRKVCEKEEEIEKLISSMSRKSKTAEETIKAQLQELQEKYQKAILENKELQSKDLTGFVENFQVKSDEYSQTLEKCSQNLMHQIEIIEESENEIREFISQKGPTLTEKTKLLAHKLQNNHYKATKNYLKQWKSICQTQKSAIEILDEEKQNLLKNNILLHKYKRSSLESKPLTLANLFKFLEEMMDQKYKTDLKDLKDKLNPKPMPEFTLEYLTRKFGIKNLALKFLSQLIPALENLVKEGSAYAKFYSDLLQVSSNPIPYNLAIYLVKARGTFMILIAKAKKLKEALQIKALNEAYKEEAMLADTLELIYSQFQADSSIGTEIVPKLKPNNLSDSEYFGFVVSHKLKKAGVNSEDISRLLKTDTIDFEKFKTLKTEFGIWVSDKWARAFFKNSKIELREFFQTLKLENFSKLTRKVEYVVSKSTYLNAIAEVYQKRQLNEAIKLQEALPNDSKCIEVTNQLEEPYKVQELLKEFQDTPVSKPQLILACVNNSLGMFGLKAFTIKGVLQNPLQVSEDFLEDIFEHTESSPRKVRARTLPSPKF